MHGVDGEHEIIGAKLDRLLHDVAGAVIDAGLGALARQGDHGRRKIDPQHGDTALCRGPGESPVAATHVETAPRALGNPAQESALGARERFMRPWQGGERVGDRVELSAQLVRRLQCFW